jgi:photosystem II stability/assembly factor-like uncharacterized protein
VTLAASTATDVVAFCDEGLWNDRPQADRAYASVDSGSAFHQVPTPVPVQGPDGASAPAPRVWAIGGSDSDSRGVLLMTADGGRTWKTVDREDVGEAWADLGFTSSRQGVVISQGKVGRLLMTADGGQTWKPIAIR